MQQRFHISHFTCHNSIFKVRLYNFAINMDIRCLDALGDAIDEMEQKCLVARQNVLDSLDAGKDEEKEFYELANKLQTVQCAKEKEALTSRLYVVCAALQQIINKRNKASMEYRELCHASTKIEELAKNMPDFAVSYSEQIQHIFV